MRNPICALILIVTVGLEGCGYFFPGFEGPFGIHSYIHNIPVAHITTELQCELRDFIHEQQDGQFINKDILDPNTPAGVNIKFQTDQSGTIQYVGIDLNKFGLSGLANLVAASNKTPSLQAKGQIKTTAFSQLDLAIAQTYQDVPIPADPKTGTKKNKISGLIHVNCDPSRRIITPLSLASWLDKFFTDFSRFEPDRESVCLSKITLSTQIVLVLDVSAGVNPLIGTTFIVPISGQTFDYNPSATQSLQIVLAMNKYKNPLCKSTPQPSNTLANK